MSAGRSCALVFELAPQARSALSEMLREAGFPLVVRATSLHDALARTEAVAFDVAFIEVSQHDDSGFEFIRSIRVERCAPERRLPIIVISADARRSAIEKARDVGAHGFVAKPFSRGALLVQLARLQGRSREWIETGRFAGPDRRRWNDPRYNGPERRGAEDALYVA